MGAPANPDVGSTEHIEAREWAERFFVESTPKCAVQYPSSIISSGLNRFIFQQPELILAS
jgi:hypothetical protein